MQPETVENSDEITSFIIDGAHRLATISMNDYGFLLSAKLAQTYLLRAAHMLESTRGFDKAFFTEVSRLKVSVTAIGREYSQFETFCTDCDRFDQLVTKDWIEWVSKCAVRTVSRGYRARVSHHLAYKIRTFHSRVCSVLTGK